MRLLVFLLALPALSMVQTPSPAAVRPPVAISEAEAITRFRLREVLETYGPGARKPDPEARVELVEGDLRVDSDLLVDFAAARKRVEAIRTRVPGDRNATTLPRTIGLIVTGDLTVAGAIINADLNGGPFFLVLGRTRARTLFAGGAEFRFEKVAAFEDAVVGCYNDGHATFAGGVDAPLVISEDHSFVIRGEVRPPYVDHFNGEGDFGLLRRLFHPDLAHLIPEEIDAESQLLPRIRLGKRILRLTPKDQAP